MDTHTDEWRWVRVRKLTFCSIFFSYNKSVNNTLSHDFSANIVPMFGIFGFGFGI